MIAFKDELIVHRIHEKLSRRIGLLESIDIIHLYDF
jgi:hypothetical protein